MREGGEGKEGRERERHKKNYGTHNEFRSSGHPILAPPRPHDILKELLMGTHSWAPAHADTELDYSLLDAER